MNQEKAKEAGGRKMVRAAVIAVCLMAVVGGVYFYCTFFPNPLAKDISPERISTGTRSITGESDILIAYFSLANNRNYPAGEVDAVASASLKIREGTGYGHAELLAMAAWQATGGDIFPIKAYDPYPQSYGGAFNRHRRETQDSSRPELSEHLESIEPYHTVILIYPNWLSSLPQPVLSFLEEYDFSDKTVIPIATSQALGLGSGPSQIAAACPGAVVDEGLSAKSEEAVKAFLGKFFTDPAKH